CYYNESWKNKGGRANFQTIIYERVMEMDFNDDERQNGELPENQENHDHQQETKQNTVYGNQSDTDKGPGLTKPKNHQQSKKTKAKSSHPLLSGLIGGIISAVIVAGL